MAVLWLGTLAALLLVGVRHAAMVDRSAGRAALATVQAHWLARAGAEQAMAILQDDGQDVDSSFDLWHHDEPLFKEVELATGRFSVVAPAPREEDESGKATRYGVLDLAGMLDMNGAGAEQMTLLPDLPEGVVPSIIDWRDQDSQATPGGAESTYYQRLDFPYEANNRPMETLEELRLVKDVDRKVFFGEDVNLDGVLQGHENDGALNPPEDDADGRLDLGLAGRVTVHGYDANTDALGVKRLNVNKASENDFKTRLSFSTPLARAAAARRNGNYRNLMALLDVKPEQQRGRGGEQQQASDPNEVTAIDLDWLGEHLDELTLSDDDRLPARINVNTASRDVLLTLPKMTEDAADAIIRYRGSDAGPFERVGDLRSSGSVNDELFKAIAEKVTVRSHVFRIDARGVSKSGVRQRLVVVIDRKDVPAKVLYWRQGEAW